MIVVVAAALILIAHPIHIRIVHASFLAGSRSPSSSWKIPSYLSAERKSDALERALMLDSPRQNGKRQRRSNINSRKKAGTGGRSSRRGADSSLGQSRMSIEAPSSRRCKISKFSNIRVIPPLEMSLTEATPENSTTSSSYFKENGDEFCEPHVCGPLSVTYTNDRSVVSKWMSDNIKPTGSDGSSFIGFDIESVPNAPWMRNTQFAGPATIQLSTPQDCLVIHLTRHRGENWCPTCPIIGAFLKDETIVKVGADIDRDMLDLYRWSRYRLSARSRFDLGGVRSNTTTGNTKERIGLKRLVQAVLGMEMKKSRRLAMSDWSQMPLPENQLAYCARDAWAGAAVVQELATRFPNDFDTEALRRWVRKERTIAEIDQRAQQRKIAKLKLQDVRSQQQQSAMTYDHHVNEVSKLRKIIAETSPDNFFIFDAEDFNLLFF